MKARPSSWRALLLGFAGVNALGLVRRYPPRARAFAGLWGLLIGVLLTALSLQFFFPFFDGSGPVWSSPLLLLMSWATMLVLLLLIQLLFGNHRLDIPSLLCVTGPTMVLQGFSIWGMTAAMGLSDEQETVLAAMIAFLLVCLMWQATLLYAGMLRLLQVRPWIAALMSGMVALLGFLFGLFHWLKFFALDHMDWNASFFI